MTLGQQSNGRTTDTKQRIKQCLEKTDHPDMTVSEIADALDLHRSTINKHVNDLWRDDELKLTRTSPARMFTLP